MKQAAALSVLMVGAVAATGSAHAQNFTGSYVGASVGGRSISNDWTTTGLTSSHVAPQTFYVTPLSPSLSYDKTSASVSVFGGFDYSAGAKAVWGFDMEAGIGSNKVSKAIIPGANPSSATPTEVAADHTTVDSSWDLAMRVRYGREVAPGTLLYGTAGIALQQVKVTVTCDAAVDFWCISSGGGSASKTQGGFTLGVGVEKNIAKQWRVRADYRFSKFRDDEYIFAPGTADEVDFKISSSSNHLRIGLLKSF